MTIVRTTMDSVVVSKAIVLLNERGRIFIEKREPIRLIFPSLTGVDIILFISHISSL